MAEGCEQAGVRCHKCIAAYLFFPLETVVFIFCYEKNNSMLNLDCCMECRSTTAFLGMC